MDRSPTEKKMKAVKILARITGQQSSTHAPPRGFTLFEVLIVLVILALATTAVSVTFAAPLRENRLRNAMAKVREMDQFCRLLSRDQKVYLLTNRKN